MCTAVVGGSIHRAATRITAAADQSANAASRSHRTNHRMKPLGGGVLARASGVSATVQNNLLRRVDLASSYDRFRDKQPGRQSFGRVTHLHFATSTVRSSRC